MTTDQVLDRLESAMHSCLESPVKGDLMTLTRTWRGIVDRAFSLRVRELRRENATLRAEIDRLYADIDRLYTEIQRLPTRSTS